MYFRYALHAIRDELPPIFWAQFGKRSSSCEFVVVATIQRQPGRVLSHSSLVERRSSRAVVIPRRNNWLALLPRHCGGLIARFTDIWHCVDGYGGAVVAVCFFQSTSETLRTTPLRTAARRTTPRATVPAAAHEDKSSEQGCDDPDHNPGPQRKSADAIWRAPAILRTVAVVSTASSATVWIRCCACTILTPIWICRCCATATVSIACRRSSSRIESSGTSCCCWSRNR